MSMVKYLEIEGDPCDIGLAHGRAFGDLIADGLESWASMLKEHAKVTREEFVRQLLEATDYRSAVETYSPAALVEIEAIAKGAEQDPELIFAWQLVDEWIDFAVENYLAAKCSSLGGYDADSDLPSIIGKTQDLPHMYLGKAVLIRTRTRNGEYYNSGVAGVLCQDGLNDRNLGVCCNHIGQLERDPKGLPVAFLLHLFLTRANCVASAVEIARAIPSASGMNYLLGDKSGVRDIEVSAHEVVDYRPDPRIERFWHTNHPLANSNYVDSIDVWDTMPDEKLGNTRARFESLENSVSNPEVRLDLDCVKRALSSREGPVSSLPDEDFPTINGLIIEHFDDPVLHFCEGAPSEGEFEAFRFD